MILLMRSAILLTVFILCSSFFWEDEEKEVRALSQSAEAAMRDADYSSAKELYLSLIKRVDTKSGSKCHVSWQLYVDMHLRLARALEVLDEPEEASRLLAGLLNEKPPDDLTPRIRLTQARLIASQSSPEKAYLDMCSIATLLPMERWSKEDLSFFHALSYSLDEYFDTLLKRAKRYFVTGYYEEAVTLYEEILKAVEKRYFPKASLNKELLEKKVRYCLAECHFSLANYEQTLALIEADGSEKLDREMIYLTALCFKQKQEYEKAVDYFEQYTSSAEQEQLIHYDHALFEIGLYSYNGGQTEKAKHYFLALQALKESKGKPRLVGALYLSRILLKEKKSDEVDALLLSVSPFFPERDPLKYELYYLRAEAAYQLGEYTKAQDLYEQALPQTFGCEWGLQARYKLGWCYLKQELYDKAEHLFEKLLLSNEEEAATLALARLYLQRQDKDASEKIEALFADKTFERIHEALLLRAEASPTFSKKESLLVQATAHCYAHLPSYIEAWYARGLNAFQKGLEKPDQGATYFEQATLAFEEALRLCQPSDLRAARILKLEAKANFFRNSPISSLCLLEKLLTQFIESCEEREETLYLRGLVASRLTDLSYYPLAEESLKQVISQYPNGNYVDDALHVLGTLYFQHMQFDKAKQIFFQLAFDYPHSAHAADGWFWAAEAVEKQDPTSSNIKEYRQAVYDLYPESPQAAEAYFRQFPYGEYVDGNPLALTHLKALPTKFPNAPLRVAAHYLIGMHETSFEAAEQVYEEGIRYFHRSTEEGKIPDPSYVHFYYETLHKLATLYLNNHKKEARALTLLRKVINDFEEPKHPLASLFAYTTLHEQCEFSLAKGYLQLGEELKAQQLFLTMLSNYRESGIQEGLYLSLTWREQGKLALKCADYATAINCLDIAEESGKSFLSDEQMLTLWLIKSECYRQQKEYDSAMRMLSKAINADAVTPLRIKAMYLRAELYELQGRPELAIRQLEAIAKKGGEWGEHAQKTLRRQYGLE